MRIPVKILLIFCVLSNHLVFAHEELDLTCRLTDIVSVHGTTSKRCYIDTIVTKSDYQIEQETDSDKDATNELIFSGTIHYLPVKLYRQIPKLFKYHAVFCSLKSVKKQNFERLSNLESINLQDNYIIAIAYETFENLPSLRVLDLCEMNYCQSVIIVYNSVFLSPARNRINYFDSAAFGQIQPREISRINLEKNRCIDESFSDLKLLNYAVEKNCMKFDFLNSLDKLQLEVDNLKEQLRNQTESLNSFMYELKIANERKVINLEFDDDDDGSTD